LILNSHNIVKVAFPREYGSWGLFLEPLILALIISYSHEGTIIGLSSFFLFLAYQPSSIIIKNKPKYLLPWAYIFLIVYLIFALGLLIFLISNYTNRSFLYPFVIAILLMIVFKAFEAINLNRNIVVELIPQVSVALISSSIILINNWETEFVIAFVIVILSRSFQTVFYINNKLKLFKEHTPNKIIVNSVGLSFFIILLFSAVYNFTPWLSLLSLLLLILRAIVGLSPYNKNEKVKIVGIKEFIYGFLFIMINSIGYLMNL